MASHLSNDDFKKMMMTPRPGAPTKSSFSHLRPKTGNEVKEENSAVDSVKKDKQSSAAAAKKAERSAKYRQKLQERKEAAEEAPVYRDRAKERREAETKGPGGTSLSALHGGGGGEDVDVLKKLSVEQTKYLGGDVEHTHLVKGLDYQLLAKVKANIRMDEDEVETPVRTVGRAIDIGVKKKKKEKWVPVMSTDVGRGIFSLLFDDSTDGGGTGGGRSNNRFLPGRTGYVFDLATDSASDLPTTIMRSLEDCPDSKSTTMNGAVDPAVLSNVTQIMSYLRQGHHHTKKRKRKKRVSTAGSGSGSGTTPQATPKHDANDIFSGVGTEYVCVKQDVSKDAEKLKGSLHPGGAGYFAGSSGAPTADMDVDMDTGGDVTTAPSMAMPPPPRPHGAYDYGYPEVEPYPDTDAAYGADDAYPNTDAAYATADAYPDTDAAYGQPSAVVTPATVEPVVSGGVFKRDDARLSQMREKDVREKEASFVSDNYTECYPGAYDGSYHNSVALNSDDEDDDVDKMDLSGKARKRRRQWDFQTDEEYYAYKSSVEATPKAAYQFNVKKDDVRGGKKTKKPVTEADREKRRHQKISNELNKMKHMEEKKKKAEEAKLNAKET
eukprot:TRINITY_DN592_c0_g1_i1.p1 TRINITY_DN592_c0_g1~~TRINITY_DN592_c0_g1_i1.p1  ORF type:complete len:608 (-),score=186.77 TRINITY_DN592_c0_g1_i1:403-2226(-)